MWLLVRGVGRGGRYFRESRKFGIASAKKLARKVSSDTVPHSELCTICEGGSPARRLWTVADAPSLVSHRRTIHRWCFKIFCATSHTVGDNKLCAIYLIYRLDLNYVMGS